MQFALLQQLSTSLTWRMPSKEKVLYLTFDDGPIPVITPWVMEQLKIYNAVGTFFCVGNNVRKHPEIYRQLLANGHRTGNHTDQHTNGWYSFNREYFLDVAKCSRVVKSNLFRPPYGKIRPTQIARLSKQYRIIMWDVLSKDYDQFLSSEEVVDRVLSHARPGSVVVFHDSIKAEKHLRFALPRVLEHFSGLGYRFESIPD
jgi:peptidoglycan/xylan/chitin deacetylase (PgdA/CDA1 family)